MLSSHPPWMGVGPLRRPEPHPHRRINFSDECGNHANRARERLAPVHYCNLNLGGTLVLGIRTLPSVVDGMARAAADPADRDAHQRLARVWICGSVGDSRV